MVDKMRRIDLWEKVYIASPFGGRVLLTMGTNVALSLLNLVTGILAARFLGVEGRGELAAIQTWPTFIAMMAMLGLPDALVYFVARETDTAGRYLGSAVVLALLSSLLFWAAGYLAMPILLAAQSVEVVTAARSYLLLIPLFALVAIPYHALRGLNDFAVWNGIRLTPSIGWLVVLAVAWLFGRAEPPFLASSYLTVLAILALPLTYIIVRRVPGPLRLEIHRWRALLHYGIPSVVGTVPQVLNLRLDQMLMAALLPAKLLGLYVVAVAWSSAVNPLLSAVGTVLFPKVASQDGRDQQARAFAQGCRLGTLLSVCMASTLIVLTPWGVSILFGIEFTPAIPSAFILVVAGAIAGLNSVMEEGLRGLGYPASVMQAEFSGLVVTAISLLVLLSPLGILGAALASLFSYGTVTIFLATHARRLTGYSLSVLLFPTGRDIHVGWVRVRTLMEARAK
jgi:O-antigen/teichoic acid export membrane protein